MLSPEVSALLREFGVDPASVELVLRVSVYLTIATIVAAVPTGFIARRKGRSVAGWVIAALCVPVVPLLVVWLLPAAKRPDPE